VRGVYDYCSHPFAPLGTKVIAFESPIQRQTWAAHGVEGWYIGPALDHYRCFTVYVNHTNAVRITDTVAWHPAAYVMPDASGIEALTVLTKELVTTLQTLHDTPPPWFTSGQPSTALISTSMHEALSLLRDIFPSSTTPSGSQRVQLPLHSNPLDPGSQRVLPDTSLSPLTETEASQPMLPPEVLPRGVRTRSQRRSDHNKLFSLRREESSHGEHPQTTVTSYSRSLYPMQTACPDDFRRLYTAVDMDTAGAVLKYKAALNIKDRHHWETAACDELRRLLTSGTGKFIPHTGLPKNRRASYYNPVINKQNWYPQLPGTRDLWGRFADRLSR
jgi:hypothetical protein